MLPWIVVGIVGLTGASTVGYVRWRRKRDLSLGDVPDQAQVGAIPHDELIDQLTDHAFDQLIDRFAQEKIVGVEVPKISKVQLENLKIEARKLAQVQFEKILLKAKSQPAPTQSVSREDGWEPVWVRKGNTATMHWGFCVWDYQKARMDAMGELHGRGMQFFNTVFGKVMGWVIAVIKAATLDVSLCVRIELPMGHIDLEDGRSFWIPCRPPVDPAIEANPNVIQGWGGGQRRGLAATVAPWPLGKTPSGSIGGAWIRRLGDHWGHKAWGRELEVYQVVMAQDGVLKSFPAMSKRDWRLLLLFEGAFPGEGLNEVYSGGVVPWLTDWKCKDQDWKWTPTSRKKAMRKFEG